MINNNIKYYRKKFKITQNELAEKSGSTKEYISEIERNKTNVSMELAMKIKNTFIELSREKGDGKQQILLSLDDLFYLEK